ncbi:hypothetical protein K0M31_016010 [Melipona bicolor]|uniref:Uncharacterized protein n=1 Tax=Melipona bicolor TaxID=60889 RepID=A0AA40KTB0_9HYME|nr:hypothetical protein K0M31_016010 [Melipona bicolor]
MAKTITFGINMTQQFVIDKLFELIKELTQIKLLIQRMRGSSSRNYRNECCLVPQELPHKCITEHGLERLFGVSDDYRDDLQQR